MRLGILLCIAAAAWPGRGVWADKPRIAVLGLEVAHGPSGVVDPGAQLIAREITRELRNRVQSPACPYVMAPNSSKDLFDEKALMSCENEEPDCMVVIGAGLASDALLYGRVEKRGQGFRISLKLLDVKRKQVQPAVDELPGGGGVPGVSRRLYRKLIGTGPGGNATLLVKARSDSGGPVRGGTVIIDDEPRGQLVNGKLTVTEVDEGRHTVAINVGGFRRFEEIVTVRGGEQATLDAQLHGLSAGPAIDRPLSGAGAPPELEAPSLRPSRLWKASLVAGAVTAAAGGAYAWYSFERQQAWLARVPSSVGAEGCDQSDDQLMTMGHVTQLYPVHRACHFRTRILYGYAIAGVGAAAAVVSLIMLTRDPVASDGHVAGVGSKPGLAIAPLIAPDAAGAQIAVAW
jgi:PEGA domain-containing protein